MYRSLIVIMVTTLLSACVSINECDTAACQQRALDFETCGWDRACYETLKQQRQQVK